jgi:hypothetical protein
MHHAVADDAVAGQRGRPEPLSRIDFTGKRQICSTCMGDTPLLTGIGKSIR